ncbi:ALK and LTK ligand 2-like [Archocentrus centrarchus]|uniref:ALK and LTK ligand 2-like n=1 Tax=Archocentrus centrarchus TaxID=63155 RepID=UPI0011EA1B9F|nr:ALK and LTK ligand 2-like [Archocentrus centrarchus]
MLLSRHPLLSALLLLLLLLLLPEAALRRGPGTRAEAHADSRSMVELIGRYPRTRTETPGGFQHGSQHGLEAHPKDPHKLNFIMHLTGPLYFSPKCKKQFHRLYHKTRDCTDPAYYKRCARLLTQLAKSPRCSER